MATSNPGRDALENAWNRLLRDAAVLPHLRSSEGLAYTLRARGPGFLADERHRVTRALDTFLDTVGNPDGLSELADEADPTQALLVNWVAARHAIREG